MSSGHIFSDNEMAAHFQLGLDLGLVIALGAAAGLPSEVHLEEPDRHRDRGLDQGEG